MDFNLSEEQQQLQDMLRRYVAKDYTFDKRRQIVASEVGYSPEAWKTFAEMGLLGVTFPEEFGGLGGNAFDTLVVMEAFGRGLVVEPYLATVVLCGGLIRDAGSQAQKEALLPAIAGGELLMAFAHYEVDSRYALSKVATTAEKRGDGYVLNGAKSVVLHGEQAGKLIVSARTSGGERDADGISLFLVDVDAAGVSRRGYRTQDEQRAAEIKLQNVQVGADALIGEEGKALPLIERAIDLGIAALCAEAVGAMDAANEQTLEYLKTRKQFGQPIGKFQALQHRMVDMFMELEQARSMAILAASVVDSDDVAERERTLSAAKYIIGKGGRFVAEQGIQLHGGIGMTWEYAMPHFAKRLVMIDHQLGDVDFHLDRFSALMETAEAAA